MLSYFLGIITEGKIYKAYHTTVKFVLVFSYLVLNELTILIRFRTMVNGTGTLVIRRQNFVLA